MPASDELEKLAIDLYQDRFGVVWPPELRPVATESLHEVWATTASSLQGIRPVRPVGLRIARSTATGLKPTSAFLAALGSGITRSRAGVTAHQLNDLLLGHRIPWGSQDEGYVALVYCEDVLGCGRIQGGCLQALIPTGRRAELLNALSLRPPR